MNTRLLMTVQVKVARVLDVGAVPYGTRRIVPLDGGAFEGPLPINRLLRRRKAP